MQACRQLPGSLGPQADDNIAVSTINLFELQFGMAKPTNRAQMEAFLLATCRRYTVLDFDQAAGRHAGAVRAELQARGTPIGPYDVQFAGVALAHDLIVVTRNVREFSRVPGLRVDNWYD